MVNGQDVHAVKRRRLLRRTHEKDFSLMLHRQPLRPANQHQSFFRLDVLETEADASFHRIVKYEVESRKSCDGRQKRRHIRIDNFKRQGRGRCR